MPNYYTCEYCSKKSTAKQHWRSMDSGVSWICDHLDQHQNVVKKKTCAYAQPVKTAKVEKPEKPKRIPGRFESLELV